MYSHEVGVCLCVLRSAFPDPSFCYCTHPCTTELWTQLHGIAQQSCLYTQELDIEPSVSYLPVTAAFCPLIKGSLLGLYNRLPDIRPVSDIWPLLIQYDLEI